MSTTEPYLQPGCACPTTHHHIATPSTCDGAADLQRDAVEAFEQNTEENR